MGQLFIENDHDYNTQKYYYCKTCKTLNKYDIELCSANKCTTIECESINNSFNVFLDISFNNINFYDECIKIELHPNNENKFILLDVDPVIAGGLGKYFYCKYCLSILGIVCVYHCLYDTYERMFFLNKDKIL